MDGPIRERYLDAMEPLFFPNQPHVPDIVQFVCALLRAGGMEDAGWDPFAESKQTILDLFRVMKLDFENAGFDDPDFSVWRFGLLFYSQIIEMDAPYDVLANLLRYRLGMGFSVIPFDDFLAKRELKQSKKTGLFPHQKIKIISELGEKTGLHFTEMFSDFYNRDLRNAISHGDFILAEDGLRIRGIPSSASNKIAYEALDRILNCSKIFFHVFYSLLEQSLLTFGKLSDRFWGYDPVYKGIFEFLSSDDGRLEGFKIHWPNGSDSYYRRSPSGNKCVNCFVTAKSPAFELFVGIYARKRGEFSPLVDEGASPVYSPVEKTGEIPYWRPD